MTMGINKYKILKGMIKKLFAYLIIQLLITLKWIKNDLFMHAVHFESISAHFKHFE
jgi:hypothetical protein